MAEYRPIPIGVENFKRIIDNEYYFIDKTMLIKDIMDSNSKNGKEIGRFISHQSSITFLADSLKGVLKNDYDDKAIRAERYEK